MQEECRGEVRTSALKSLRTPDESPSGGRRTAYIRTNSQRIGVSPTPALAKRECTLHAESAFPGTALDFPAAIVFDRAILILNFFEVPRDLGQ